MYICTYTYLGKQKSVALAAMARPVCCVHGKFQPKIVGNLMFQVNLNNSNDIEVANWCVMPSGRLSHNALN